MLERKIIKALQDWKDKGNKKSLIVKGARQVGKTFAILEFGKRNYKEVVYINFKETPSAQELFKGDLSIDSIVASLKFRFPQLKIEPGMTLIFFDEIQECEEATTALKFWTIDGRYDVIASGSLLGIDYKRASSYPVGYVDYLRLTGLDFEEFLWAMGISGDLIDLLRTLFEERSPVPNDINRQLMQYFRSFIALGGMPEVVQTYVMSKDYREADRVQKALLQGYLYDIAHYAQASEKIKAEKCFLSLTKQLLDKENHKFQYKEIEHGGKAQKYYSSLEWLERADIVSISKNVSRILYDLTDYEIEDNFRVYPTDMSLLIAMRDIFLKQQIIENSLVGSTKGGIYECAIADSLIKAGNKLYFYKNETQKSEVDFLIQKAGQVVPIEVKSGTSRATSLVRFMRSSSDTQLAYKLCDGNIGVDENGIVSAPLYMAMFI